MRVIEIPLDYCGTVEVKPDGTTTFIQSGQKSQQKIKVLVKDYQTSSTPTYQLPSVHFFPPSATPYESSTEKRGRKKRSRDEMRSEAENQVDKQLIKKKRNNYASARYRDGKAKELSDKKKELDSELARNVYLTEKSLKYASDIAYLSKIIA